MILNYPNINISVPFKQKRYIQFNNLKKSWVNQWILTIDQKVYKIFQFVIKMNESPFLPFINRMNIDLGNWLAREK